MASFQRLDEVKATGAWAFTIGGAFFEKKFGEEQLFLRIRLYGGCQLYEQIERKILIRMMCLMIRQNRKRQKPEMEREKIWQ